MADVVATQILQDGPRMAVMKFTNLSDGTGEAAVLKVDVSTLGNAPSGKPCTGVNIAGINAQTTGMGVNILWDATTDVLAFTIPPDSNYDNDFTMKQGPIPNNAGTGKTGDIMFTTVGASANDAYSIILVLEKQY